MGMHAGKLTVRQTKQQTDGQTYTQISNSPMHTDPSRLMVSAATGYAAGHDVIHGRAAWCKERHLLCCKQELDALHKHMQAFHEQRTWSDGVYDGCASKHW